MACWGDAGSEAASVLCRLLAPTSLQGCGAKS